MTITKKQWMALGLPDNSTLQIFNNNTWQSFNVTQFWNSSIWVVFGVISDKERHNLGLFETQQQAEAVAVTLRLLTA